MSENLKIISFAFYVVMKLAQLTGH